MVRIILIGFLRKFLYTYTMSNRAFFNFTNNRQVTAAGVLIHDAENDRYLLQYMPKTGRFDDFGGKVEWEDDTVLHTILRELYEETNGLMCNKSNPIKFRNAKFHYIKNSKYLLVVIDSRNINIEKDLNHYLNNETCTNINRKLVWVYKNEMDGIQLNPRLKPYFDNSSEEFGLEMDFIVRYKELYHKVGLRKFTDYECMIIGIGMLCAVNIIRCFYG